MEEIVNVKEIHSVYSSDGRIMSESMNPSVSSVFLFLTQTVWYHVLLFLCVGVSSDGQCLSRRLLALHGDPFAWKILEQFLGQFPLQCFDFAAQAAGKGVVTSFDIDRAI